MINILCENFEDIKIDEMWNFGDNAEFSMHSIHSYPAKFPAFIAAKAFAYAKNEGVHVRKAADVFCGCGTVALEAKLHNIDFWGSDINPVATLITEAKCADYSLEVLDEYFTNIEHSCKEISHDQDYFDTASERLKYWFMRGSYNHLYILKQSIYGSIPNGIYQDAFLCLYSSILKASSKWLTKSIKPQIDPNKKEIDVWALFTTQYKKFRRAVNQIQENGNQQTDINIETGNFLSIQNIPKVNLIVSSPPYVTSYEYADLHQLTALWLGFSDDYRDLRRGSIGSVYNSEEYSYQFDALNTEGQSVVNQLEEAHIGKAHIKSVARYYIDIQTSIRKCATMLEKDGMVIFVVGDTEYKGVRVTNSKHLIQCLYNEGFRDIKAGKRKISQKILTPYRDRQGKFSADKTSREVYHEEYIISGRMK